MREVKVTNMTSLFKKEMLMYSFFDIRLKRPIRVVGVLYFFLLFFLIGLPTIIFLWPPGPYSLAIALGVPYAGAKFMSKPIWNGKSFFSFIKTQIRYLKRPKVFYDGKEQSKNTTYEVDSMITVSRHDDFAELYEITKEEEERALVNG